MFSIIKIAIVVAAVVAAHYTGFLVYIVAGIVAFHVLMDAKELGAVTALQAYALPAAVAVLGVAALNTQRLDFMMSVGLAVCCAVAYGVLRPKRPRKSSILGRGVFAAASKLV